jgi:hypothetical protein
MFLKSVFKSILKFIPNIEISFEFEIVFVFYSYLSFIFAGYFTTWL